MKTKVKNLEISIEKLAVKDSDVLLIQYPEDSGPGTVAHIYNTLKRFKETYIIKGIFLMFPEGYKLEVKSLEELLKKDSEPVVLIKEKF